jgi:hypothetical protein
LPNFPITRLNLNFKEVWGIWKNLAGGPLSRLFSLQSPPLTHRKAMLHSLLVPSSAQDVQRNFSMSKKQDPRKLSENTESHEIQEVSTIVQLKLETLLAYLHN